MCRYDQARLSFKNSVCAVIFHWPGLEKSRPRQLAGLGRSCLRRDSGRRPCRGPLAKPAVTAPLKEYEAKEKASPSSGEGPLKACQPAPKSFSLYVSLAELLRDGARSRAQRNLPTAGMCPLAPHPHTGSWHDSPLLGDGSQDLEHADRKADLCARAQESNWLSLCPPELEFLGRK